MTTQYHSGTFTSYVTNWFLSATAHLINNYLVTLSCKSGTQTRLFLQFLLMESDLEILRAERGFCNGDAVHNSSDIITLISASIGDILSLMSSTTYVIFFWQLGTLAFSIILTEETDFVR